MNNSVSAWFQNLQDSDLQPIVSQILDRPNAEVLTWQIQPLSGGATQNIGISDGVHHVTGTARDDSRELPWSAVVKILKPSANAINNDPANFFYWKREALAYQSGLLDQLPGNLVAPRCYAIQELPAEKCCLWLEAVDGADDKWTLAQHQLAARHLGQFNGAYLAGYPLPAPVPWLAPNRINQLFDRLPLDKEQLRAPLRQFAQTNQDRWPSKSIDRILRLWAARPALLAALERLPSCFCHNDAFRRNLMLRQRENGLVETVAIDWALAGLGKVGQEIGPSVAVSLLFMEVAADQVRELDEAIFAGYSAGLRDAGWQGDLQLARFGYMVIAALFGAVTNFGLSNSMHKPEAIANTEALLGYSMAEIIDHFAVVIPFLLDLGDEALALLPSIERIIT